MSNCQSNLALVADGHPLCRSGMMTMLDQFHFGSITSASDFAHLRRALAAAPETTFAAISIDLPGLEGSMGLRRLRLEWPELRIAVLSDHADRNLVLEVPSAGVHGVIPKSYTEAQIRGSLEVILQGQIYVPNIVSDLRMQSAAGEDKSTKHGPSIELTERQNEVLRLLAVGKSNKEIARTLNISEGTVKVHVNASFRALGVHNRVSAAAALAGLTIKSPSREQRVSTMVDSVPLPLATIGA